MRMFAAGEVTLCEVLEVTRDAPVSVFEERELEMRFCGHDQLP
jgi:hypothetical protein